MEKMAITSNQYKFYKLLFEDYNKKIEIRLIDDKKQSKQMFLSYKELQQYDPPQNTNVYVGMFERKDKSSGKVWNCTKTSVLYLDFDEKTLDEIMYRIDNKGLPYPSMITHSGHGYHVYWKLDKPRGHEVQPILKALASELKADTKATDIARVLRVPDTMNIKKKHVKCTLVEMNNGTSSLKTFSNILNVKPRIEHEILTDGVKDLNNIKFNGLNNMAAGVEKGERNFCTGRIVQTLKRLNYTKLETSEVIYKWNLYNRPKKDARELKKDINTYWHDERYRYDGKEFSDERLQELNERFIDENTKFFLIADESTHHYDNELLKPDTFPKISGLTFAILSIVKLAENEGIRREHIADLCKRHQNDKNIRESLKTLHKMKHIKIIKKDRTNFYIFSNKPYARKRGYTTVGKSLHRSFIHGELKEHEYKLMILLENYAYDDKTAIFPSNQTLALRTGKNERSIRRNIKQLEHKQFIKTSYEKGRRWIRFIYR